MSEQKNQEQLLKESEERYRQLVEDSKAIILTHDEEGRIRSINRTGAASLGYEIDEMVGKKISAFIEPKFRELFETEYLQTIQEQGVANGVLSVLDRQGKIKYWLYKNVLKKEEHREPIVIGYGQEITQTVLAEKEMKKAQAETERLLRDQQELTREVALRNEELDRFAYIVSHDLKQPLRGIRALTSFLQEDLQGKLDEDTQDNMDLLISRVTRMENLIDGVLSYSRAARLERQDTLVDLQHLVPEIVDLLAPPSNIEIQIQEGLPTVKANPIAIQQVFQNLIGNAIEYAAKEAGKIRIGFESRPKGGFRFEVEDNGVGIDPKHHQRIFDMFQTLVPKDKRDNTGIGLAIVKKIVASNHGEVGVESEEGTGAKFWFTWPDH